MTCIVISDIFYSGGATIYTDCLWISRGNLTQLNQQRWRISHYTSHVRFHGSGKLFHACYEHIQPPAQQHQNVRPFSITRRNGLFELLHDK